RRAQVGVVCADTDAWLMLVQRIDAADPQGARRIRLMGTADADATVAAAPHSPETGVYTQPVTSAGRLEMLPFVRKQSVTMTAHRFGTLNDLPQQALGEVHYG